MKQETDEEWEYWRNRELADEDKYTYQGVPFLRNYRWYRRLIGGRWAQVSGLLWNKRWVHISDECVETADEDWR